MRPSFFDVRPGSATQEENPKLTPVLNAWLGEKGKLPNNRRKGVLSPSSISQEDFCAREAALKRLVPPSLIVPAYAFNPDPPLQRAFDMGTAVHNWFQNEYLGPMGVLWGRWECSRCQQTVKGFMPKEPCLCRGGGRLLRVLDPMMFKKCMDLCGEPDADLLEAEKQKDRGGCLNCGQWGEWRFKEPRMPIDAANIWGSCDGFLFFGGVWRVLEIKTCSSNVFRLLNDPKKAHVRQDSIYSYASQFSKDGPPGNPDVVGVHYLYMNKDWPHPIKEFIQDRDEDYMASLLGSVADADRAVEEKNLDATARHCKDRKSLRAKNCPLVRVCFRHGMTAERATQLRTLA